MHLRVIFDGALPAARNMALDEALLETAGPPVLRLYGWQPPALSLGRGLGTFRIFVCGK